MGVSRAILGRPAEQLVVRACVHLAAPLIGDTPTCRIPLAAGYLALHLGKLSTVVSRQSIPVHQATLPYTGMQPLETPLWRPAKAVDECSRQTSQRYTAAREAFEDGLRRVSASALQ